MSNKELLKVRPNESLTSRYSTKELYRLGWETLVSNHVFQRVYGKNSTNEDIRRTLLEIDATEFHRKGDAAILYKKMLEEYDIDSFKRLKNEIIKEIYLFNGYSSRRKVLQKILNRYSSMREMMEDTGLEYNTIYNYGVIFNIDVSNYNFKSGDPVRQSDKYDVKQYQMNSRNKAEEQKMARTDAEKLNNENLSNAERENLKAALKKLRQSLQVVFSEDYLYNEKVTNNLEFEREFKIVRTKLKQRFPESHQYFTRKRFNRWLLKNLPEDAYQLDDDGETIKYIKHTVNMLTAVKKTISRFYVESDKEMPIQDIVDIMVNSSNIIDAGKLHRTISRYYGDSLKLKRKSTSKNEERSIQSYIRNYLKLYVYEEEEVNEEEQDIDINDDDEIVVIEPKKVLDDVANSDEVELIDKESVNSIPVFKIGHRGDLERLKSAIEMMLDMKIKTEMVITIRQ